MMSCCFRRRRRKERKKKREGSWEEDGRSGQNMGPTAVGREEKRNVDSNETSDEKEKAVNVVGVEETAVHVALTAANVQGGMGNKTINISLISLNEVGRPLIKLEALQEQVSEQKQKMISQKEEFERNIGDLKAKITEWGQAGCTLVRERFSGEAGAYDSHYEDKDFPEPTT